MTESNPAAKADTAIIIVSPYAAHPGHHWNNAEQIGLALLEEGRRIAIFVHDSTIRTAAGELAQLIHLSPPWWRRIVRIAPKVPGLAGAHKPLETLGVLMAISRTTRRPDRVVFHFVDATFLVFFVWEFFAQRRCVYNVMGDAETLQFITFLPNPLRWLKRKLTRWFLAVSLRRGLVEFCAETEAVRLDWAKIVGQHAHYIPYAISPVPDPIPKAQARAHLNLRPDETVLLLFGTQRSDKDFATVIRAARDLSPSPFLLFAGKHISGSAPSVLLPELGFTAWQVVDRFVTEAEARMYFAACDAVVLPYNENYEKGSGVLIEACQHRRPVIATDTGYLREFVREHRTGWLFRFGDPDDLGRCMKAVANISPAEELALQQNISAVASDHSWKRIVRIYLALYSSLEKRALDYREDFG